MDSRKLERAAELERLAVAHPSIAQAQALNFEANRLRSEAGAAPTLPFRRILGLFSR